MPLRLSHVPIFSDDRLSRKLPFDQFFPGIAPWAFWANELTSSSNYDLRDWGTEDGTGGVRLAGFAEVVLPIGREELDLDQRSKTTFRIGLMI